MADGRTHTRVTLISGGLLSATLAAMGFHDTRFLFAGFVYQVFMSCDQDVDGGNISLYYLRKTFFLHYYWQAIWYPYSTSMVHRGKSHATYGTAVRFLYLLSPFVVLIPRLRDDILPRNALLWCLGAQLLCIPLQIGIGFFIATWGVGVFCLFICGVFIGDLLHLAFDSYWYRH